MDSFDNRASDIYPANPEGVAGGATTDRNHLQAQVKRVSLWACLLLGPILALRHWLPGAPMIFRLLRDSGVETTGRVESRWVWNEIRWVLAYLPCQSMFLRRRPFTCETDKRDEIGIHPGA